MFLRQTLKYAAVKAFQGGILYLLIHTHYCWYRAVRLGYWEVNKDCPCKVLIGSLLESALPIPIGGEWHLY
jgi:hypothetical protein